MHVLKVAEDLASYVTIHPDQLSLAIPPWAVAMITSHNAVGNDRYGSCLLAGKTSALAYAHNKVLY